MKYLKYFENKIWKEVELLSMLDSVINEYKYMIEDENFNVKITDRFYSDKLSINLYYSVVIDCPGTFDEKERRCREFINSNEMEEIIDRIREEVKTREFDEFEIEKTLLYKPRWDTDRNIGGQSFFIAIILRTPDTHPSQRTEISSW